MVRVITFIVILLSCSINLFGQTLEGVVRDAKTKEPVDHAVVYLNGTTNFTVTNPQGEFKLVVKIIVSTSLIINHVAYDEVSIANPFSHIPEVVFLEEKATELDEVRVVAKKERYTRAQKLVAFREQFLGTTEASKWCTILNEDDIRLSYIAKTRTLIAKSEVPIEIMNSYLGYKITFTMKEFEVNYSDRSIDSENIKLSWFIGSSLFTDLHPENTELKNDEMKAISYLLHISSKT